MLSQVSFFSIKGGAVSIEPQRSSNVTKLLHVISNEDKMEVLFRKIAHHGHQVENIRHVYLGQDRDTLCLPEILLFIAKNQDLVFSYLRVDPLSIIKESFYYAMHVDTTRTTERQRIKMKKDMDLLSFFDFMANLFMFSRLWEIFSAVDDGIEDEIISKAEFCRAKGKLEGMGGVKVYRQMTDEQWARGFHYIDDSNDEMIEFAEFVQFCCKFIISPEDYLIKAISVCVVKRASVYDLRVDLSKPALQGLTTVSSFLNSLAEDSGEEDDVDNCEKNDSKDDTTMVQEQEDNDKFETYLREVKASGLASDTSRKQSNRASARRNIIRTYSDVMSQHGYDDHPSAEQVASLDAIAKGDATKLTIDEWTDQQVADYNRRLYLGHDPDPAEEWRQKQLCVTAADSDYDFYSSEQQSIVAGYLNLESLDSFSIGDEEFGVDDHTSLERGVSASTLQSIAQKSKSQTSHHQEFLFGGGSEGCIPVGNHGHYYEVAATSCKQQSPRGGRIHGYGPLRTPPPEDVLRHLQPGAGSPTSAGVGPAPGSLSKLEKFMRDREALRESMYRNGVIASLACGVKRNLAKAAKSPVKGGMNRNVRFGSDSRVDNASTFEDDMSDYDDNDNASLFSSSTQLTTSTPSGHIGDTGGGGDDTGGGACELGGAPRVDVVSLIEKMILAQFQAPKSISI